MNYDQWVEKYKPIKNYFDSTNDIFFETFGEELDFVKSADPKHVWTLVDGYEGTWIVSEFHVVNRIAYAVTEMPHNGEQIEVLDMLYGDINE